MKKIIILIIGALFLTACGSPAKPVVENNLNIDLDVGEVEVCSSFNSGEELSLDEAFEIAQESDCADEGTVERKCNCNEHSGTCWLDFEPKEEKRGCNPACVVDVETKSAEINWRCTGLIAE